MTGLPWVRLDTAMPTHPKILRLLTLREGHRAAFVFCASLSYCGQHGTDGAIEHFALPMFHGRPADAARLVDVGLWHQHGHGCEVCPPAPARGWIVHDWPDYQQVSAATQEVREAKKAGAAKGNCIRWHGPACGCWRGEESPGRPLGVVR